LKLLAAGLGCRQQLSLLLKLNLKFYFHFIFFRKFVLAA